MVDDFRAHFASLTVSLGEGGEPFRLCRGRINSSRGRSRRVCRSRRAVTMGRWRFAAPWRLRGWTGREWAQFLATGNEERQAVRQGGYPPIRRGGLAARIYSLPSSLSAAHDSLHWAMSVSESRRYFHCAGALSEPFT